MNANMPKTIFVVDDSDTNLSMAEEALESHYRVITLPSAAKMFAFLEKIPPDLILLDIEMPGMGGFEALQRLKAQEKHADIPVIFLTGITDAPTEAHGFELGAVDFITKPFSVPVLLNRIKTHLHIDTLIRERTTQLRRLQSAIVYVFADIIENRDKETGGHIERTTMYVRTLLDALAVSGVYSNEVLGWDRELVSSSARLHDVGKIAISDFILNKPGPLTQAEYETMKTHASEGERIITQIITRTDEVDFLRSAKLFAGYHHENWDGTGYPHGSKGEEIPLHGRIMSIVDVYDALISERPYKKAFTEQEAMDIITAGAGTRFDPKIVAVFRSM
jgi:putative two-component system response regulator